MTRYVIARSEVGAMSGLTEFPTPKRAFDELARRMELNPSLWEQYAVWELVTAAKKVEPK